MNLLAIDTSGPVCGVAIWKENAVAYEAVAVNRLTHSVNLMPMIEEGLTRAGLEIGAIDLFAAVVGPGSFTGVRIGVSAVKGLAHGANRPCVAVNALEALAAGVCASDALLCPIQDARAGQVYGAAFEAGFPPVRRLPDEAIKLDGLIDHALLQAKPTQKLCFLGDGVVPYREAIETRLGERACFAPPHQAYLRPASVAMLALEHQKEAMDYLSLMPHYLRAPQAERARAAKLAEARP